MSILLETTANHVQKADVGSTNARLRRLQLNLYHSSVEYRGIMTALFSGCASHYLIYIVEIKYNQWTNYSYIVRHITERRKTRNHTSYCVIETE